MSFCLVKSINKTIAVLNCTCNTFQSMRLHFAQRNHAVPVQKLLRKNKLLRLDPFRVLHMNPLCIINRRDIKLLQISVHSGSMDHLTGRSVSAGICQNNILISLFSHQSGKHTNDGRMCDDCLIHFCFLKKIRFQQN